MNMKFDNPSILYLGEFDDRPGCFYGFFGFTYIDVLSAKYSEQKCAAMCVIYINYSS